MRFRWVALVGVLVTGRAAAQAPAMPVVNAGSARGFTLGAALGTTNAAGGDGTGYQVAGTAGFRRFSLGGFVTRVEGSSESDAGYYAGGANLGIKLLGGPLVPLSVNLLIGAAYSNPTRAADGANADNVGTRWHLPVGLGIAWTIPQPVVALKPWIAPRLDYTRLTIPDPLADPVPGGPVPTVVDAQSHFGLSGGISFGFLNGLAIDVAVDRVFTQTKQKPTTIGVGVSYTIK